MKKLITFATAALIAGIMLADAPIGLDVGIVSAKLLPRRNVRNATAWATNTAYTQGALVKSGPNIYMTLIAGTSEVTAPKHGYGTATNGTTTLLKVHNTDREGFDIVNIGAANVFVSIDYAAETNKGVRIVPNGWFSLDDGIFQGPLFVISEGITTNRVIGLEH